MTARDLLTWKSWFYQLTLPRLARLDPQRADHALAAIGRGLDALYWPRHQAIDHAVDRAAACLGLLNDSRSRRQFRHALAANAPRFLARDVLLESLDDSGALARVDFDGWHHVESAMDDGRGVLLVGAHFGAYLTALHALYRRGLPLRVQLQRPQHVSAFLRDRLDDRVGPQPQAELLLKRRMPPADAARALLNARAALRSGLAVATFGDVTWPGGRSVSWLGGHPYTLQSAWLDLAIAAGVPVVPMFAIHQPGGRYRVIFDPPRHVDPKRPEAAQAAFLARVEQIVRAYPHEALAYWTWPAYRPVVASSGEALLSKHAQAAA